MILFNFILSLFMLITPSSTFDCDGDLLIATIRNNLNGDFALTKDLDAIDQGAFVVLNWRDLNLMLPVSFQYGEISFTDRKWLWSYKDISLGLHENNPRLANKLPSGRIIEYECKLPE